MDKEGTAYDRILAVTVLKNNKTVVKNRLTKVLAQQTFRDILNIMHPLNDRFDSSSVSVSSMAMSNSNVNVSSTKYPYVTVLLDDKVDIAMQFNKQFNCVHYNLKESNENPDRETEMEFVGATGSDSGSDEAGTSGRPSQ